MLRYALLVLLQLRSFGAGVGERTKFWTVAGDFPQYKNFGQISAVAIDSADHVYVFHRGNRVWDYTSFSANNIYQGRSQGPVEDKTIVVLDPVDGAVRNKAGARIFFMPHGLTVDHMNNIWVTDVALHQVFKFPPLAENIELSKPLLILGEPFVPGSDLKHFCKPTDVAVNKLTGDFYVADGYCNSRIIKYDKYGNEILHWGRGSFVSTYRYILNVPHALVISHEEQLLFVADRENRRTLAYEMGLGTFNRSYEYDRPIYSVAHSSVGGSYLFTLSNESYQKPGVVTVYDIKTNKIVESFPSSFGFSNPHDVAVSADGKSCYVVELNPYKIWKFRLVSKRDRDMIAQQTHVSKSEVTNLVSKFDGEEKEKSAHEFLGGTLLAISIVTFVVLITFIIFICHIFKKKSAYTEFEMRRLILDDEEEIGINVS